MKTAKHLALIGEFLALLIAGQYLLSGIAGVEIVTVLFACFCFYFGVVNGLITATLYSLLRCFIFGFFPNVIVLYLVYFNIFAIVFGLIGRLFDKKTSLIKLIIIVVVACIMTCLFTLLDNIITPLMLSMSERAWQAYVYGSFVVVVSQVISTAISVSVLFVPLTKAFSLINI